MHFQERGKWIALFYEHEIMEQKLGLRSKNEIKYRKIDHVGKNHWMGFDDLLDMSRGLN